MLKGHRMKTIFDWLTMPAFRERMGMYIGQHDLSTLTNWMHGYISACEDAKEHERLRTPNGIPIDLLRDYIAMKEGDSSTGGIPYILQAAANGNVQEAVDRFFSYVDEFMRLEIKLIQRAQPTDEMQQYYSDRYHMTLDHIPTAYRKISLTDGLCWLVVEAPDSEYYFRDICETAPELRFSGEYSIGPESWAERFLTAAYGESLQWVVTDESCYPQTKSNTESITC